MPSRRQVITSILGTSVGALAGCGSAKLDSLDPHDPGQLLSPNFAVGHRIRDGQPIGVSKSTTQNVGPEKTSVLIVGGGMAGLSAAWQLARRGIDDFIVLELESQVGGTSLSGTSGSIRYPWGAHYVPVPMRENRDLVGLLEEMRVVTGTDPSGSPIVAEQFLCRQPQERVFFDGQWWEGLFPRHGSSDEDQQQLTRFRNTVGQLADRRDTAGRRLFAIPISSTSAQRSGSNLDRLDARSMADWMDDQGLDSPRLRWLVDYSCRDDYGVGASGVSAWAGLFYFAARLPTGHANSQEVITWPEGNGRIVDYLASVAGGRVRAKRAVGRISQDKHRVVATVIDTDSGREHTIQADRLIFAAPQFIAKHTIEDFSPQRRRAAEAFRYGSWVVANVHLRDRPFEAGFPMCWDNVMYGSRSLGYVNAVHQTGRDYGPTVLTWYYPLSGVDPSLSRQQLLSLTWRDWADVVLADLLVPHPDIMPLVRKIDFMRWGHAMVTPRVGFYSDPLRRLAATPLGRIHFAAADLSGVALMEEAMDHGARAAGEVARALGHV